MRSLTLRIRMLGGLIGSLGLVAFMTAIPVSGHEWTDTLTQLTFSGPVALPGVALPAGQYKFEAIRGDVVRVSSRDARRVFFTGFTNRVPRPAHRDGEVMVSLGEATNDAPAPITVWYPMAGEGHEFIYR